MILRERCITFNVSVENVVEDDVFLNVETTDLRKDGELHNETHPTVIQPDGGMEQKFTYFKFGINFYILDADPENYMVIFACKNFPLKVAHIQMAWIWTRNEELENKYLVKALEVLNKFNISTDPLEKTDRAFCY